MPNWQIIDEKRFSKMCHFITESLKLQNSDFFYRLRIERLQYRGWQASHKSFWFSWSQLFALLNREFF